MILLQVTDERTQSIKQKAIAIFRYLCACLVVILRRAGAKFPSCHAVWCDVSRLTNETQQFLRTQPFWLTCIYRGVEVLLGGSRKLPYNQDIMLTLSERWNCCQSSKKILFCLRRRPRITFHLETRRLNGRPSANREFGKAGWRQILVAIICGSVRPTGYMTYAFVQEISSSTRATRRGFNFQEHLLPLSGWPEKPRARSVLVLHDYV